MASDVPPTFELAGPALYQSALRAQWLARTRRTFHHDARNVIQSLHSGLELLAKSLQPDFRRRVDPEQCIEQMRRQVAALEGLLEHFVARLGGEEAPSTAFDLCAMVNETLRSLTGDPALAAVKPAVSGACNVLASRTLLERTLSALLLQAADDARGTGSVMIDLSGSHDRSDHIRITLAVRGQPNGRERSERADVLTKVVGGMLEPQGVAVVMSVVQEGYDIQLTLPAHADKCPHATEDRRLQRLLVVDSNADAADSLAMLLELQGHDVGIAYSDNEARQSIGTQTFAAVLLSLSLPEPLDQLAQAIRHASPTTCLIAVGSSRHLTASEGTLRLFDAVIPLAADVGAIRDALKAHSTSSG